MATARRPDRLQPGWGCELVIEHQLTAYKLRGTVTHNQGSYAALITDTIARYKQGKPILYYTWTPYWVSGVLQPGKDVVWLQVPHSSLPGEQAKLSTSCQTEGLWLHSSTQHRGQQGVCAEEPCGRQAL